ncbi:hypothetical protein CGJ47_24645 [Vibrio parahaemolyticus]|uniref:hypothetical protein n=1 Tax=Vibrio parahaemolyticus TaxID=670 RepID=UPI001123759C|nr:hypothetical protein [Vibrio parahaemolyticus]TOE17713.1 hypothetical protein CGJ47_24645 [Vibrio parahaemolyticus]
MINRTASTQYDDWTGGSAFDDADTNDLTDYARNAGHIQPDERIFSFEASYIHVTKQVMVTINYTSLRYDEVKSTGASLSKVSFDLSPNDFFGVFKRTNFAAARKGL